MSELEDLIPPLELCKMIPDGHFADSALVWARPGNIGVLVGKDDLWEIFERASLEKTEEMLPAPTTDEILAVMAIFPHYFNNAMLEIDKDAFIVGAFKPNRGKPGSHLTENRDARPVVAALRLYLGLSDPSDPSEASDKTPDAGHNSEEVKK